MHVRSYLWVTTCEACEWTNLGPTFACEGEGGNGGACGGFVVL